MLAEKIGEVARDRGIGLISKPHFADPNLGLALGEIISLDQGKETLHQHRLDLLAGERGANRAANQRGAAAKDDDGRFVGCHIAEQRLFGLATALHQAAKLPVVEFGILLRQFGAHTIGQGQVHVVATEQDVDHDDLTHRDPELWGGEHIHRRGSVFPGGAV